MCVSLYIPPVFLSAGTTRIDKSHRLDFNHQLILQSEYLCKIMHNILNSIIYGIYSILTVHDGTN